MQQILHIRYTFLKIIFVVKKYVENIVNCWISRSEFETIRLIGSGAFGDVSVVRWKTNGQIYALKSLHKYDMLKRSDVCCFLIIFLESLFSRRKRCHG